MAIATCRGTVGGGCADVIARSVIIPSCHSAKPLRGTAFNAGRTDHRSEELRSRVMEFTTREKNLACWRGTAADERRLSRRDFGAEPKRDANAASASPRAGQMTISPKLLGLPNRTAPKLGTGIGDERNCAAVIVASSPLSGCCRALRSAVEAAIATGRYGGRRLKVLL